MQEQKPKRAKRVIKSIDFSGEGAAVSLVGTSMGGPANGVPILLLKSKEQNTDIDKSVSNESESVKAEDETSSIASEVNGGVTASEDDLTKGKLMTKEVKVDAEVKSEVIEKAQFESLQKAMEDQKVALQKAQDTIASYEKEKQEQIVKSKTAQITAVVTDAAVNAPLVKAALSLESADDFTAFVTAVTALMAEVKTSKESLEKSLTEEIGVTVGADATIEESPVARILKAAYNK